ncbi:acetyl-/propionyl-coenzyme A carboxylase subunit alpha, partial [Mycolicibacterium fortuitum subsp. fortuitum DSM 46621 = ATCC 6841 = JCM 6387]
WTEAGDDLWARPTGWRVGERAPAAFRLRAGERTDHVYLTGNPEQASATVENGETHTVSAAFVDDQFTLTLDGIRAEYLVATQLSGGVGQLWLAGAGRSFLVEEVREAPVRPGDEHSGDAELVSPMPGSVVAVGVASGTEVTAGTMVVTVEAMKMEHALTAPTDGVAELLVAVGDQVKVGQPLARITAATQENEQ